MKVADLFALLSMKVDEGSFRKTRKLIDGVKSGLKTMALAGGVASAAVLKMISDTANAADQFAKLSSKVGISVENLQGLEFAAGISGTKLGILRKSLERMSRTADDAGQGLKTAQEPFRRLGISAKDSSGNIKDMDQLLLESADAFAKLAPGIEKSALAQKLFGKSGAEIIPLLNEGSEGIKALRSEFKELGGEITSEQAAGFEEFNDTILRVKTALIGFRNQAVVALLPHLKRISGQFLAWVKANRQMLKQRLIKFMKGFVAVLLLVGKAIGFLIDNGESMLKFWVAWKVAIVAVQAAMAFLKIASVGAAIASAKAWIAAALPLVLMTLLVAALAALFLEVFETFQGKQTFLRDLFDSVVKKWGEDIDGFFRKWEEKLKTAAKQAKGFLKEIGVIGERTLTRRTGPLNPTGPRPPTASELRIREQFNRGRNQRLANRLTGGDVGQLQDRLGALSSTGVLSPQGREGVIGGGGAGPTVVSPSFNVTINGATDTQQTKEVVERELKNFAREMGANTE